MPLIEARAIEPSSIPALQAVPARTNGLVAHNDCELVGVSADNHSIQLHFHSPAGDIAALVIVDFTNSTPTLEPWLPHGHRS